MGAILVPLYWELSGEVLSAALRRLDVAVVITEPGRVDEVAAMTSSVPQLKSVLPIRDSTYSADIARGATIEFFLDRPRPQPDDPTILLSTSGTTGVPKGMK
jgi:crotonobetaine/carnitine-CoA ligase